ncbi:MAG TPA: hypothetical protein VKU36_03025 [Candidatus Babeliales bacterium]|nr:hypothetical protein [Candidatus Babeliales bacterium]
MNKIMFAIIIITLYTSQNSAMEKLPFIQLYTEYSIVIGQKYSKTPEEFYQKILPYHDTPEIRQAITSILKDGETKENTLNDKQIITSLLNSKTIPANQQEMDKVITMLDRLDEKGMKDIRHYVCSTISQ